MMTTLGVGLGVALTVMMLGAGFLFVAMGRDIWRDRW